MAGGPKRGAKTELAIAALLTHHTFDEAAAAVGVCKRTLMRWLREPDFRQQYLEARRQVYSQAIGLAQQALSEGVTVLRSILNDDGASTSARVAAFARLFSCRDRMGRNPDGNPHCLAHGDNRCAEHYCAALDRAVWRRRALACVEPAPPDNRGARSGRQSPEQPAQRPRRSTQKTDARRPCRSP